MKKFVIMAGTAFGLIHQANAAEPGKSTFKPALEDDERILDGLAIAPLQMDATLAGFDIEWDTSLVREARVASVASVNSLADFPVVFDNARPARLTDMRVSVRRSVPITNGLLVDMLLRAEIPTGNVRAGLGRGRSELMADLGIRAEINPVSLWLGGARRFNKTTRWSPGRDVNEIYAGWNARIGKKQEVRMDFASTSKRSYSLSREWHISGEYSHAVGRGKRIAMYIANDVGPWGKDMNAGVTVRYKF